MNPLDFRSLSDAFTDPVRLNALELALQKRESAYDALRHAGDIAVYQEDEPLLLRFLTLFGTHAHWMDGDVCFGITTMSRVGRCCLLLMKGTGSLHELQRRFELKAHFLTLKQYIESLHFISSPELAPLELVQNATDQLILRAPRVKSVLPTALQPPPTAHDIRVPAPTRVPQDLYTNLAPSRPPPRKPPPPPRRAPTPLTRIELEQIAVPLTPSERPVTERPPVPSEPVDTRPEPGRYSSTRREAATLPKPATHPLRHASDGEDVDDGWD